MHKTLKSRIRNTGFILLMALLGALSSGQSVLASQDAAPLHAVPAINFWIDPLERIMIGETFDFVIVVDETTAGEGYRPFVDLLFPTNGADGAAGTDTPDGISFVLAQYEGISLNAVSLVFPDADGADSPGTTGCVSHPFAFDTNGVALQICGTAGDTLVVLELPFSSITVDTPELWIVVTAQVSVLADVDVELSIKSRTGYAFGSDPLNNPCCDAVILSHSANDGTGWPVLSVVPKVVHIEKTYDGPVECPYLNPIDPGIVELDECPYMNIKPVFETVTGPNYARQYTLTVDVAAGQTVTDLDITDLFPNNLAFISVVLVNPASGAIVDSPTVGVAANPPDNDLIVNFPSVTGTAQVVVSFFAPEFDADGVPVLDPNTGNESLASNIAYAVGDWIPVDPRDPGGPDNAKYNGPCPDCVVLHKVHLRSLAVQKTVTIVNDTGTAGYSPGDRLKYTLDFQVSDYFSFGNLILDDTLYDGQRIDLTPGFLPTYSVSDRNTSLVNSAFTYTVYPNGSTPPAAPIPGDDLIIDETGIQGTGPGVVSDGTDGETLLRFFLSRAMLNQAEADGILEGGEAVSLAGPAFGTITFNAIIQEDYSDSYPSGDASVDHGDKLINAVVIDGSIRENGNITNTLGAESNNSDVLFEIPHGNVDKTVYAVNGNTTFTPEIQPQDTITFRLTYNLPNSDSDLLTLIDYLPMPIFGVGEVTTFNDVISAVPPAAGQAQFGPTETLRTLLGAGVVPTMSGAGAVNTLTFAYAPFDDPTDTTSKIDILYTVTMSDDPYPNGLTISNLIYALEDTTNYHVHDDVAIAPFVLKEPGINLSKGVVAGISDTAIYMPNPPSPVPFNPPGSAQPWNGTIPSGDQDPGTPLIDSDVWGIRGGDIFTFAVVLENLGDSTLGAFDISVKDTFPANMQVPAGGLNLQVRRGDGVALTHTPVGAALIDPSGFFDDGILIDDSVDGLTGAAEVYDPSSGRNIIVITYDLQVVESIPNGTEIINTATLMSYAGTNGGPNHVGATPTGNIHTDDALVTTSLRWTVTPPPGSLPDGSVISILETNPNIGLSFGSGVERVGVPANIRIYDPQGIELHEFNVPMLVCYYYSDADLAQAGGNPGNMTINTAANGASAWQALGTTAYPSEKRICADVYHFSLFIVTVPLLPATGFAPDQITERMPQPEEKSYAAYGDMRLEIPKIHVDIPIVGVPKLASGWDLSWLNGEAGYLAGTAFPTWEGNTALTAHVYDADGNPGPFAQLSSLQYGDRFTIRHLGLRYTYEVRSVRQVAPDDLRVLSHETYDWVTLLTCKGYDEDSGLYALRTAVRAVLVIVQADN